MDPLVANIIIGTAITIIVGIISYLIKSMITDIKTSIKVGIDKVGNKLDEVLTNQQDQRITIVKMEKDIATTIDISKDLKSTVNHIDNKVQEHAVVLAELKEWKKNREEHV